ncbi:MAG TPA: flagellar hook capping FlgD N-terminal domain-containing protein [Bacteroidales bacterium]|nr:flagellar hook capping FlgD N-terminal domain-containing protein [Bacteroidales bacterium]
MKVNNYDDLEHIYKFDDKKEKDKSSQKNNNDLDKDAFLRLLTTQLSNQDPLNPIEDREFIAQLAQFTSLEQMQNLNKNFETLGEEVLNSIDYLNFNQIQANVAVLKEITNMRKAMENYFGIKPNPIDISQLQANVELAKELKEKDFTSETWEVLQTALVAAKAVVEIEEPSIEEIEDVYNELISAIEGLRKLESEEDN